MARGYLAMISMAGAMGGAKRAAFGRYGGSKASTAADKPPTLRQKLHDEAAWLPRLTTDANGEVQTTITLPDNLTAWRFTARVATKDFRAGDARVKVLTQLPVEVRLGAAKVLHQGDQTSLMLSVMNQSKRSSKLP